MVAFRGSSDGHKSLVAVVLRLVDFDYTAAELSDLVNLSAALTNDGADHVVRDENLLGQRLARDHTLHRLVWWAGMAVSWLVRIHLGLMRAGSSVAASLLRGASEVNWCLSLLLRRLTM